MKYEGTIELKLKPIKGMKTSVCLKLASLQPGTYSTDGASLNCLTRRLHNGGNESDERRTGVDHTT